MISQKAKNIFLKYLSRLKGLYQTPYHDNQGAEEEDTNTIINGEKMVETIKKILLLLLQIIKIRKIGITMRRI